MLIRCIITSTSTWWVHLYHARGILLTALKTHSVKREQRRDRTEAERKFENDHGKYLDHHSKYTRRAEIVHQWQGNSLRSFNGNCLWCTPCNCENCMAVAERSFGFEQRADCVAEAAGLSTACGLRQNHWLKDQLKRWEVDRIHRLKYGSAHWQNGSKYWTYSLFARKMPACCIIQLIDLIYAQLPL